MRSRSEATMVTVPTPSGWIADKRGDYFLAGTLVVWDVDVLKEKLVRVYRADHPTAPTVYRIGRRADAEPTVPGWSMPVADLFPPE